MTLTGLNKSRYNYLGQQCNRVGRYVPSHSINKALIVCDGRLLIDGQKYDILTSTIVSEDGRDELFIVWRAQEI